MALAAATPASWSRVKPTGQLSAAVLLGAVQRLYGQRKAVVGAACMAARLPAWLTVVLGRPPNRAAMQLGHTPGSQATPS